MLKQVNKRLFDEVLDQFSEDQIFSNEMLTCAISGDDIYAISFQDVSYFVSSTFNVLKIGDKSFCVENNESRIN